MDGTAALAVKKFIVEVEFDGMGPDAPPLRIPVQRRTPEEALRMVKQALLESTSESSVPAGGSAFTVAVFPDSYEAGTEAFVAERITLVTMPFADEVEPDET